MQLNETVKEAIKMLSEIHVGSITPMDEEALKSAIKILEDGLQLTQQKSATPLPCCGYEDTSAIKWNHYNSVVQCHNCGQVYTSHQPTRLPLKDKQIIRWITSGEYNVTTNDWASHINFASAVEAAHGIK